MPEKGICHLQSPQTLVREPRLLGKHRNDLNYRDAQCNSNKPCVSQQPITFDNLSSPQRYSSKGRTLLFSLCKLPSRFLIVKPSQMVRFAHPGCIKLQRTGCYAKDPNRCNTPAQRQHYPPPIVSLCWACHCCQQPELTHSNGRGEGLSIAVAAECWMWCIPRGHTVQVCHPPPPPPTATATTAVALVGETCRPVTMALPAVPS